VAEAVTTSWLEQALPRAMRVAVSRDFPRTLRRARTFPPVWSTLGSVEVDHDLQEGMVSIVAVAQSELAMRATGVTTSIALDVTSGQLIIGSAR